MGAGQSSNGNSVPTNGSTPSNTGMVVTSTNVRRNAMNSRKRRNNGMNAGGMNIAERSITVMDKEPMNNTNMKQAGGRRRKSRKLRKSRKIHKGSRKH